VGVDSTKAGERGGVHRRRNGGRETRALQGVRGCTCRSLWTSSWRRQEEEEGETQGEEGQANIDDGCGSRIGCRSLPFFPLDNWLMLQSDSEGEIRPRKSKKKHRDEADTDEEKGWSTVFNTFCFLSEIIFVIIYILKTFLKITVEEITFALFIVKFL
jgi:hypothetical protein